jgi:hypothetical protein
MNVNSKCWRNGIILQDRTKDVSWWMPIKETCRFGVLVIVRLSKEGCISLAIGGRPSCVAHRHDWSRCGPLSIWKTYYSKIGLLKIQNLKHKYETTKAWLPRKIDGAYSSIERRPIPPKDIGNRTRCLAKGPWKDSHDPRPILSPHAYIIPLLKPTKRNRNEYIYSPCEIRRSMNYTWRQNAQNNLNVSQEKKIIKMRHVLR